MASSVADTLKILGAPGNNSASINTLIAIARMNRINVLELTLRNVMSEMKFRTDDIERLNAKVIEQLDLKKESYSIEGPDGHKARSNIDGKIEELKLLIDAQTTPNNMAGVNLQAMNNNLQEQISTLSVSLKQWFDSNKEILANMR